MRLPQTEVIRGFKFSGKQGDALRAWLELFPGDIDQHVQRISAAMKRSNPRSEDLTLGEYVVFHSLFLAATLQLQSGHALWDKPKKHCRFRKHPDFGEYMARNRFDDIKAALVYAVGDPSNAAEDEWWEIRPLVSDFSENRRRKVVKSEVQVPDEAMSAFCPRSTPSADLAHLSYVERKPKPLGTEFKCVVDGGHGLMRELEIQEGKDAMEKKKYRGPPEKHNPATATALRLVDGVEGW